MTQLFIQMSGAPGAGKSTIAQAIAPQIGAVIVDHDITKSALLDADIPFAPAGKASYFVLYALAKDLLKQGFNIIFDSPCFYNELLEQGQKIAQEANAQYAYIECVLHDLNELDQRLKNRPRRRSQVAGINQSPDDLMQGQSASEAVFRNWINNMKRPKNDILLLDTSHSIDDCTKEALIYLENRLGLNQTK